MAEVSEAESIPRTGSYYYPEPIKAKKRDRTQVTADMLRVCLNGATRTQIVYRANLNFKVLKIYLSRLVPVGLVELIDRRYFTTDAGREYIYHAEMVVI